MSRVKDWRIGFFVIGMLIVGGSTVWAADEPTPSWWAARSLSGPRLSAPPLALPEALDSIEAVWPEAAQPVVDETDPTVVTALPRASFERWRRLQPYSAYRDPITVYLLQDE